MLENILTSLVFKQKIFTEKREEQVKEPVVERTELQALVSEYQDQVLFSAGGKFS